MQTVSRRHLSSVSDLAGRNAVVLGLARSGVAAARFLAASGARVTAYDRRAADALADALATLDGSVALALGVPPADAERLLAATDLVVTSPSISSRFPTTDPWLRDALRDAEQRGVEVVSEVDLFLRLTDARVLAVTGTKGKTTVTALLGAILEHGGIRHLVGGNIGTPLVEHVAELGPRDWVVLELSELQLPTISRGADLAVYTNITADHLDRHGTVEAYRAVKARLAHLARGPIVINGDDPGCVELAERLFGVGVHRYGLSSGEARLRDGWLVVRDARLLPVDDVPLPGEHMLRNVLGAALAAWMIGVAPERIASAIRDFSGVPHRLETIGEWGGVRWVNDSQATIPDAAIAALHAFAPRPVVLIAGGSDKGLEYDAFADTMAQRCRAVVLIGETGDRVAAAIAARLPVERAGSMEEAVRRAGALARPGDVVLLAPAAASFDMFTDYAARGDSFRRAALAANGGAA